MKELGVFCGTFNPIHWAHLLLAECARDQFHLEKVLFVTSPNPPHRHTDLLDGEDRHKLVVAACKGSPHFEPSRIELNRLGTSYTIETLREIQREKGDDYQLNLILGEDNFLQIGQWHEAINIFRTCRLLVAPRSTTISDAHRPAGATMSIIEFPKVGISGSMIRDRIRAGKSILYMVPPAVNDLILQNRYYAGTRPPTGR